MIDVGKTILTIIVAIIMALIMLCCKVLYFYGAFLLIKEAIKLFVH
ncbi:hypothetical protein [Clostridium sp.]